jgi:hypothetical protein
MTNDEIDLFLKKIKTLETTDDVAFTSILNEAYTGFNLEVLDVAHAFGISFPTVERWLAGKTMPHPMMRSAVFDWLIKFAPGQKLCGECGHAEKFHNEDDGWTSCIHGSYVNEEDMNCYPCNCGNNIGR